MPIVIRETRNTSFALDTVAVIHARKTLRILFKAKLEYGRQRMVQASDSARVIAVLIDPGQEVNKNDLILGLWLTGKDKEKFSRDVLAPFSGSVIKVFVQTGQMVAPSSRLAFIVNNNFLKMKLQMKKSKLKYIRRGQKVFLDNVGAQMFGYVQSVNRRGEVDVLYKNEINAFPLNNEISGYIDCGKVNGNFIDNQWFAKNDSIQIFIDKESSFSVYKVGMADTLALLSTSLTGIDTILVMPPPSAVR